MAKKKDKAPKKAADEALSYDDPRYWFRWLSSCGEASKRYFDAGKSAWREYLNVQPEYESASQLKRNLPKRYPLYWAAIKTIRPAYYSKTPIPMARRKFDADDPIGRTACILAERGAQYLMECSPFDQVMGAATDDFILTDRSTARVYFEGSVGQEEDKVYIEPTILEDGSTAFIDAEGNVTLDVEQDDDGQFYTTALSESYDGGRVYTLPLCYDDVFHTPYARHWEEVEEVGFKSTLTKQEFIDRFGPEIAAHVAFKQREQEDRKNKSPTSGVTSSPDLFCDVWEIWRKRTSDVIWITDSYKQAFLDLQPDPYELEGFFPCAPFIIGTKPDRSLYPTPAFIQLRPIIDQMNSLYNKVFELISAVRRRGLADASIDEVIAAINGAWDNEIMAVQNFAQIVEKGGLANLIQYLPVQELSDAIVQLQGLRQQFKDDFDELYGISDILRGNTEAGVGVETQQLKAEYASLRSTVPMKQVQKLARDLIELQLDLALKKFPDEQLAQIFGFEYLDENDQLNYPQAVALLKDDKARHIRIDIETDSTSYIRDEELKEQRNEVIQTILAGLDKISALSQEDTTYTSIGFKLLLSALRGQNLGKTWEQDIQEIEGQVMERLNQPPPPAPPDYEAQKLQIETDKLAVKQQTDTLNAQVKQQQNAIEQFKAETEAYQAGVKLNLEKMGQDLAVRMQLFDEYIERSYAALEGQKVMLDEREKYMTEYRLQAEAKSNAQIGYIEATKPVPVVNEGHTVEHAPQIHIESHEGDTNI